MKEKIITCFICLIACSTAFSQTDSALFSPVQTSYKFDWGNNQSTLVVSQYGKRNDIVLVHLHDDEVSSLEAAKLILQRSGGLLIQLKNHGKRLMSFKKSGKSFLFDPNRIFTTGGIRKNLLLLNPQITSPAVSSVKAFATFIILKIPGSINHLVALHNNDKGKYSIRSYKPGGTHAKDALDYNLNEVRNPDNFFIVTDKSLFGKIKTLGYNVVLQDNTRANDDGSLSILCAQRNVLYANVEAAMGRRKTQVNMLKSLLPLLK